MLKNRLIESLITCAQRFITPNEEGFLIVSTTGLGDTLWGTPALRALRERHPKAYIGVLTSPMGGELLKHNPYSSELFIANRNPWKLFTTLRKRKIGTIYLFHTSQRWILPLTALLGAKKIIGTIGINKGLDSLLTNPLPSKPQHEIVRRLEIIGSPLSPAHMELFVSPKDEEKAACFLSQHQISSNEPLIGLHPGAKDLFKQWPPEGFIAVGNRLKELLGCRIVVTGAQDEKPLVEEISSKIEGAIPLAGELPVRSLAALYKRMSLLIVNDTGPMHVAFAMNTPTVALFAPTDSKLCGPCKASNAIILQKQPTCTPCLRKKCLMPFCMLQHTPSSVIDAALKLYS